MFILHIVVNHPMEVALPGSLRENVLRSTVAAIVFAEAAAYYVVVDQQNLDRLVALEPEPMAILLTVGILAWIGWFSLATAGMNHGFVHGIITGVYTGIVFHPVFAILAPILKGHGVDGMYLIGLPWISVWSFLLVGWLTIFYGVVAGVTTAAIFKIVSAAESRIEEVMTSFEIQSSHSPPVIWSAKAGLSVSFGIMLFHRLTFGSPVEISVVFSLVFHTVRVGCIGAFLWWIFVERGQHFDYWTGAIWGASSYFVEAILLVIVFPILFFSGYIPIELVEYLSLMGFFGPVIVILGIAIIYGSMIIFGLFLGSGVMYFRRSYRSNG